MYTKICAQVSVSIIPTGFVWQSFSLSYVDVSRSLQIPEEENNKFKIATETS